MSIAAVARRERGSDADMGAQGTDGGVERVAVGPTRDTRRRDLELVAGPERDEQREFSAGIAHQLVALAQRFGQPATHGKDEFVGRIITIAPIDRGEIGDADDQQRERRVGGTGFGATRIDPGVENAARAERLVDAVVGDRVRGGPRGRGAGEDAYDAMHAAGLSAAVGEPATEILDIEDTALRRADAIGDTEGRALTIVAREPVLDRLESRRLGIGGDQSRESDAGRQRGAGESGKGGVGVRAPFETVRGNVPIVHDRVQRRQDRNRIAARGRRRGFEGGARPDAREAGGGVDFHGIHASRPSIGLDPALHATRASRRPT